MCSALYIKMSILATESCINISSVVVLEVSVLLPSGLVTSYCLPWLSIFVHQYAWLATARTSKCKTLLQFPILHHIQSDCPPSFLSPLPSSRGVRRYISRENVNQSEHILVAPSPWMTLCITENHKGTTSDKLSPSFYQAGLDSSPTKNISKVSLKIFSKYLLR